VHANNDDNGDLFQVDGQYKDLEGGNLVMIPGHHIQSWGFIRPLTLWWLDRGKGRIKF
jgi:hypothetical protein